MRSTSIAFLTLLLVTGCKSGSSEPGAASTGTAAQKPGTPLAKVGNTTITVEELEERINAQGPFARPRYQDPARRKEFLEGLIRQELLAQEALRRGYDKDPEVQDAVKKVMVQKLTRQEYDTQVKQEDIRQDDIKKYYDEHPDEFHKPEMVRCQAVIVNHGPDEASKAQAKKRAEAAHRQVMEGMKKKPAPNQPVQPDVFRDVVTAMSEDQETKSLGGDLRYLSQKELEEKYGPKVAEACFALTEVNDVSGVVEGKSAFFVLKNAGRRKPIDRTLEQVETQIRNRLFREKRTTAFNDFVEGLKQKSPVSVDENALGGMKIAGPGPGGPQPGALPPPQGLAPAAGEAQLPGHEKHDDHGH